MFTTILYPTDFSETAEKSLPYLKELRNAGAAKVIVLNVIHQRILDTLETVHTTVYFQDGRYQEDMEAALARITAERTKQMAPLVAELEDAGFEVQTVITTGYPFKEIMKLEKGGDISAIVMGSHGRSNFRRARIGSVSEKVMRRSLGPVLIVKRSNK